MHKKKCMEIIRFNGHSSTVQKGQSIHSYITWYWTFVQCQSLCFFKVLLLKVKKVLTHSATVTYKPSNKNCKAATKLWGGKGTYSNGKYINIEINEGGCHPPVAQSTNEQTRQKWDLVVQQKFKVSEEPNTSLKQLRFLSVYLNLLNLDVSKVKRMLTTHKVIQSTCCELRWFSGCCFLSQIHGDNKPTRLNLLQNLIRESSFLSPTWIFLTLM